MFDRPASIFDAALVGRLSDPDVREHVRAVFVPLVRARTIKQELRKPEAAPVPISSWKPFQVTASERRPVLISERTVFNLVPCNRALEAGFAEFCNKATDIVAFAKNAGPQALRVDYLGDAGRPALYLPDFLVRGADGKHYLVETKGQVDRAVPRKVRAAIEWCKAAKGKATWDYLYIPEDVFGRFSGNTIAALAQACAPALTELRQGKAEAEAYPLFAGLEGAFDQRREEKPIVAQEVLEQLPLQLKKAALEAIELYRFLENKPDVNLAPSFTALLGPTDELATATLSGKLMPYLPKTPVEQADWFEPDLRRVDSRMVTHYQDMARNLKRTLLYKTGLSPLGLLRNCLDYTLNDNTKLGGVFGDIKTAFRFAGAREVLSRIGFVNEFRNTKVAHQQSALTDAKQAREALVKWVDAAALIWSSGVQPAT